MLYKQYSLISKVINKLENILIDNYISEYEKIELIEMVSLVRTSTMYNETTLSLQILNGIIDGIISDKIIDDKEIYNLNRWLKDNDYLADVYPYDKILLDVNKILEDGIISEEEKNDLLHTFNEIINPSKEKETNIDFTGKSFCLSGEFLFGSKMKYQNY